MLHDVQEIIQVVDDRVKTIGNVITFLKPRQVNEIQHYEFELSVDQNPISADELHELTKLPYEIALTEKDGKVILNTGNKSDVVHDDKYMERSRHSRLSLHTHHEYPEGLGLNTPSFADVIATEKVSEGTPLLLVSPTGIMIYQEPKYDPFTNQKVQNESRDLIIKYGEAHRVDTLFSGNLRSQLKKFANMDKKEGIQLQRQFTIDTKMIVQEVAWSDTEGIQKMMDIINLRTTTHAK